MKMTSKMKRKMEKKKQLMRNGKTQTRMIGLERIFHLGHQWQAGRSFRENDS